MDQGNVVMIAEFIEAHLEAPFLPEDSFAEHGLDSLAVVELIMEMEQYFDIEIPDRFAEKCETFGELANLAESIYDDRRKDA
jgi:acyl carrier protein